MCPGAGAARGAGAGAVGVRGAAVGSGLAATHVRVGALPRPASQMTSLLSHYWV